MNEEKDIDEVVDEQGDMPIEQIDLELALSGVGMGQATARMAEYASHPDRRDNDIAVRQILARTMLSTDERKVVNFRYFHDLTYAETSRLMKTSTWKVRQFEASALKLLREEAQLGQEAPVGVPLYSQA